MSTKESSAEMAHLASLILQTEPCASIHLEGPDRLAEKYNLLLQRAKSLAGSVLSQREVDEPPAKE